MRRASLDKFHFVRRVMIGQPLPDEPLDGHVVNLTFHTPRNTTRVDNVVKLRIALGSILYRSFIQEDMGELKIYCDLTKPQLIEATLIDNDTYELEIADHHVAVILDALTKRSHVKIAMRYTNPRTGNIIILEGSVVRSRKHRHKGNYLTFRSK